MNCQAVKWSLAAAWIHPIVANDYRECVVTSRAAVAAGGDEVTGTADRYPQSSSSDGL